ncbi:MAG: DUF4160 domain-containing protein [Weeksellaceae bacterium]|nr:DUF4160 domain-containing protein [Weeksellaceae bacterium]
MPTIFEYLGIIVKFWSDEHYPIHVHAFYADAEIKVEIILKDKEIIQIKYLDIGKNKFTPAKRSQLEKLVESKKEEIVKLWIKFFVYQQRIRKKVITAKDLK